MSPVFNIAAVRDAVVLLPQVIAARDVERARALVREHGIVDAPLDKTGLRALMLAGRTGDMGMINMLLEERAYPLAEDEAGNRASFFALGARHHDACLHLMRVEDDRRKIRQRELGPG